MIGIDNLNDYCSVALKRGRLAGLAEGHAASFRFHEVDFANMTALAATLGIEAFDVIAHLGAQVGVRHSIDNPHAYVRSNRVGHLNLLEIARHRTTGHVVYASSSSVYGANRSAPFRVSDRVDHPISLYATTRKTDELVSETYAPTIACR